MAKAQHKIRDEKILLKVIELPSHREGTFIERKNRFLGIVEVDGKVFPAHIHDPGRLKELLYPGARVLLREVKGNKRKTPFDILASWFRDHWVLVHSGVHRNISERLLKLGIPLGELSIIFPEPKVERGRLDFYFEKEGTPGWIEVKGCTLCVDGAALFPDAPTERGRRHLEEMEKLPGRKVLIALVFRKDAKVFLPNVETDPRFTEAFLRLLERGMEVYPLKLEYDGKYISFSGPIPLGDLQALRDNLYKRPHPFHPPHRGSSKTS